MALDRVLSEAFIPELPNYYKGKVRENYDLPDGNRIIIATDRISAFDRVLAAIPFKGQVLTQTARFWFDATADICPNHVVAYPDPNVVIGRRLDILPVEVIVRGYLAGTTSTSVLTKYRAGERRMYGLTLPDGLYDNEKLLPDPHTDQQGFQRRSRRTIERRGDLGEEAADAGTVGHRVRLCPETLRPRF